ncbi:MAG: hypothetical protein V2J51_17600 [Erythrobacter sp.]|jgi:hypothetical protein|nr:hypothetical protein [Erythrobacter sp.]
MPQDKFDHTESVSSPARECAAIVPNDAQDLAAIPKALYVGTGGDLNVRLVDNDADVVFRAVPGGSILAIRPVAVRANGTSAADIVGLL